MKKAAILALLGVAAAGTAAFCAKVIKKYNQEQEDDYTECDCGCDECNTAEEEEAATAEEAAEESAEVCEEAVTAEEAAEEDAAVAEEAAAEVVEEPEVTIELTIEEAKPEENEPEEELEDHEEII